MLAGIVTGGSAFGAARLTFTVVGVEGVVPGDVVGVVDGDVVVDATVVGVGEAWAPSAGTHSWLDIAVASAAARTGREVDARRTATVTFPSPPLVDIPTTSLTIRSTDSRSDRPTCY